MKQLIYISCLSIFLFLSCQSDNLVYYIDGKVVAHEQQKSTTEKSFSFDLTTSKDFKVYVEELSELTALSLKIKSNFNLDSEKHTILIDGKQFELKNHSFTNNNIIELDDPDILTYISNRLLLNKNFNLILNGESLNNENEPSFEMTLDLKGTFLGVH